MFFQTYYNKPAYNEYCCLGESFKAHRLVLAACSTHFSKIFSSAPLNGQLIVILDGTRAEDLQILLQFMYR